MLLILLLWSAICATAVRFGMGVCGISLVSAFRKEGREVGEAPLLTSTRASPSGSVLEADTGNYDEQTAPFRNQVILEICRGGGQLA